MSSKSSMSTIAPLPFKGLHRSKADCVCSISLLTFASFGLWFGSTITGGGIKVNYRNNLYELAGLDGAPPFGLIEDLKTHGGTHNTKRTQPPGRAGARFGAKEGKNS